MLQKKKKETTKASGLKKKQVL